MKHKIFSISLLVLVISFLTGCANNTSGNQSASQVSKYDRTPFAVYVYDGNKEIVLYENPQTASVNGKSGSWTQSNYGRIYERYGGRPSTLIYVVWYGSETLVISPHEELIFFGTEDEAEKNEEKKYIWKECEKKRL